MNVTAIITCKDRTENLKFCLSSIAACRQVPFGIVVDFGSNPPIAFPEYKDWLRVIRVDRDTEMFHKARAINIGIKHAQSSFVCITDADQIFQPNFFSVLKMVLGPNPKTFVMCRSFFIANKVPFVPFDRGGKMYNNLLQQARVSGILPHGDGCCNGVSRVWAEQVRGYDETYVGYRAQDSDFALRAIRSGLTKVWIHSKTSMIHLPHTRIGEYYANENRVRNKQKYKDSTKLPAKNIIVANKSGAWGEL
jgi:GT2 family glycosyltransferase